MENEKVDVEKKRKKRKGKSGRIVIVLIVVLAALLGGFFLYKKKTSSQKSQGDQSVSTATVNIVVQLSRQKFKHFIMNRYL